MLPSTLLRSCPGVASIGEKVQWKIVVTSNINARLFFVRSQPLQQDLRVPTLGAGDSVQHGDDERVWALAGHGLQ